MSWRAYCGDYQRTLLLTSGWWVPGAHYLGPCNGASTDFDMHSDSPTVRAGNVAPDLCRTCGHPLSAHDAISLRWCAASELGVENRVCICSGVVRAARVLTHY
jgi:hypothetical protein